MHPVDLLPNAWIARIEKSCQKSERARHEFALAAALCLTFNDAAEFEIAGKPGRGDVCRADDEPTA